MSRDYETLCDKGQRLQREVSRDLAETRRIAQALSDAEETFYSKIPYYRDELAQIKAKVARHRIELSRHVAHCTDSCKRASDGGSFAARATAAGANSRAPSHQKPPVPGAPQLALMLQEGQTVQALADIYERHPSTIMQRLAVAGFSSVTGLPTHRRTPEPELKKWAAPVVELEPWRDDALCAQTDPEAFYPDKGGSTRAAKKVCLACTVRQECLEYALTHGERFGIWGGLSERERRARREAS